MGRRAFAACATVVLVRAGRLPGAGSRRDRFRGRIAPRSLSGSDAGGSRVSIPLLGGSVCVVRDMDLGALAIGAPRGRLPKLLRGPQSDPAGAAAGGRRLGPLCRSVHPETVRQYGRDILPGACGRRVGMYGGPADESSRGGNPGDPQLDGAFVFRAISPLLARPGGAKGRAVSEQYPVGRSGNGCVRDLSVHRRSSMGLRLAGSDQRRTGIHRRRQLGNTNAFRHPCLEHGQFPGRVRICDDVRPPGCSGEQAQSARCGAGGRRRCVSVIAAPRILGGVRRGRHLHRPMGSNTAPPFRRGSRSCARSGRAAHRFYVGQRHHLETSANAHASGQRRQPAGAHRQPRACHEFRRRSPAWLRSDKHTAARRRLGQRHPDAAGRARRPRRRLLRLRADRIAVCKHPIGLGRIRGAGLQSGHRCDGILHHLRRHHSRLSRFSDVVVCRARSEEPRFFGHRAGARA